MSIARRAGMQPGRRAGRVRGWFDAALFYLGLASFGLMCLVWSLPAGVLHRLLPARIGAPIGQFGIMGGFRIFIGMMKALGLFRCDLTALDGLRHDGPLIIAVNHPSLLDALLVISRLPRVVCITKAGLWDNWFLGGGIRLAAYIRNDAPLELTRLAVAELRAGHQLLIFPEGTRTRRGPVDEFKGGFAIMARNAGVPIQTVFLDSDTRYLTKGWTLFRRPDFPLTYRVRLGKRLMVTGTTRAFTADLQRYFADEVAKAGPESGFTGR